MRYLNRDCMTFGKLVDNYIQRTERLEQIASSPPNFRQVYDLERVQSQVENYRGILSHWEGRCTEIEKGRPAVDSIDQLLGTAVDVVSFKISHAFERKEWDSEKERLARMYFKLAAKFPGAKKSYAIENYMAEKRKKPEENKPGTEDNANNQKPKRKFARAVLGFAAGVLIFMAYKHFVSDYKTEIPETRKTKEIETYSSPAMDWCKK